MQEEREPTRHTLAGHDETELLQVGAVGLDPADEAVFEAPQLLSGIRWFKNTAPRYERWLII